MKETIIDGVNVAECDYILSNLACINKDIKMKKCIKLCSNIPNCIIKNNLRLQQENKKLKESANEAKIEYENLLINRNNFAVRAKKLEQENEELKEKIDIYENSIIANHDRAVGKRLMEVLQALEEIRENLIKLKTNDEDDFCYEFSKLQSKINEVLK